MLLDQLVDLMVLLPEDRENLLGRGFTDEIIKKYSFKSCHPDNQRVLKELENKAGLEALAKELLYLPCPTQQNVWVANEQLLEPRILIPYYDENKDIIKVRPHKRGFKGQPSLVYRTESSFKKALTCIIAESEFKAIAAEAYGFSAIGIPGISSMSGKNWDYFTSVLDSIQAEEFVICFDNEIKDNPEYSNFKADWRRRYDTFIYAYAMATKILDHGRNCKVATLPVAWLRNGKIDIDSALARGYTSAEFTTVINNAMPVKKYIKHIPVPEKHRPWISKRIRCFFHKSKVYVKNNEFWIEGKIDPKTLKSEDHRRIANCYITIQNMYEMLDDRERSVNRDVVIKGEYGMETHPIPLKATHMNSKSNFIAWLMGQGNFLFYGRDSDVTFMWEYIFNHDESNIVYLLNRCGHIPEYDFWIFANMIIKDGKAHPADDNGICWVDDVGYKINKTSDVSVLPALSMKSDGKFNMKKFVEYMSDTCDAEHKGLGKALIGWALAVLFSDNIFNKTRMFPILNLYGTHSGGKSTIMRWLLSMFGDNMGALTKNLGKRGSGNTTPVGIARSLHYYCSLPFIVEDWRATPDHEAFIPIFLGAYGRQGGVKGVKGAFGTQELNIRAALGIIGEDMIEDPGVNSRCVSFHITAERLVERMEEMNSMSTDAAHVAHDILLEHKKYTPKILSAIDRISKAINKQLPNANRRVVFNYAVLQATYNVVIEKDKVLEDFILNAVANHSGDLVASNRVQQFAEDFSFGVAEAHLQVHHYKYEGNHVILWAKGINDVMNKYYNRRTDQFKLIMKQVMQRKFFVKTIRAQFQGVRNKLPAIVLDLTKMPENLRCLFEAGYDPRGETD